MVRVRRKEQRRVISIEIRQGSHAEYNRCIGVSSEKKRCCYYWCCTGTNLALFRGFAFWIYYHHALKTASASLRLITTDLFGQQNFERYL